MSSGEFFNVFVIRRMIGIFIFHVNHQKHLHPRVKQFPLVDIISKFEAVKSIF